MSPARTPHLDPSDIKLLRVFRKVVESGGFVGAQAELNVGASTVSTQMTVLEMRLGMRLCDRGRVGFRLTDEGRRVYAATLRLEEAIDEFRTDVGQMRGKLFGELHIGIVDSTVTNADCRLSDAIDLFIRRHNDVHLTLHIAEPASIEKRVQENQLSVGIAAFHHHVPGLCYEPLFRETQGLFCGPRNPLFQKTADEISEEEVLRADYVSHGYVPSRQSAPTFGLRMAATAYDMEAVLTMVRAGNFVGHLPIHYAAQWVEQGMLKPLLPGRFSFETEFEAATRRGNGDLRIISTFLEFLRMAHGLVAASEAR